MKRKPFEIFGIVSLLIIVTCYIVLLCIFGESEQISETRRNMTASMNAVRLLIDNRLPIVQDSQKIAQAIDSSGLIDLYAIGPSGDGSDAKLNILFSASNESAFKKFGLPDMALTIIWLRQMNTQPKSENVYYDRQKKMLSLILPQPEQNYWLIARSEIAAVDFWMQPVFWISLLCIAALTAFTIPYIHRFRKKLQSDMDELLKSINIDRLTLLPNRGKLFIDIRNTNKPTLLLINLDDFKEINNFYGNEAGDYLLISVANRIKYLFQSNTYRLYRLQSDEFAVLLDSTYTLDDIKMFVEFLHAGIADKIFVYQDNELNISATIGVATYESCEETGANFWQEITVNANMALHKAKQIKTSYLIFDESREILKEVENNVHWSKILKRAIKDDNIVLYCQPIVNNQNKEIEKYECLVRLLDETGNVIPPAMFLDVSKKIRLYHVITRRVVDMSFEIFKDYKCEFSLNLSILDILNRETHDFLLFKLQHNPETASRVVLEILESEGIEEFEVVCEFIRKVKALNCKIAIDDFGSGYSNFENIVKLGVDYLKIDGSLIRDVNKDSSYEKIVRSITHFAHEMGIKTVAEFVSEQDIQDKIVSLGVDYSQGYLFGKPSPFSKKN